MQKLSTIPRFEEWMNLIKERETPSCPICRQPVNDPIGKEFLKNVGNCASCDHIEAEREL